MPKNKSHSSLHLKAGEWVEIRGREEILATLDQEGRLEQLPFMEEMFQYCGKKYQVFKRADKTCDYIQEWSIRRMTDAVHLDGLRCDGSAHDGCQAGCLLFWKESWLKRANSALVPVESLQPSPPRNSTKPSNFCTVEEIRAASCSIGPEGEKRYMCQATDVPRFTSRMSIWDPRQYIRDLRSGNLDTGLAGSTRSHRLLRFILTLTRLLEATIIGFFNEIQERRRGSRYPFIEGTAQKSPLEILDLQPGELVEVRSKEEILATLDKSQRNRGLWFDSEMLPYCGGIYRVLRRVRRIIDEKTRKMVEMKNSCIVLEGVVCKSDYHRLCPRAIYPYWRETWLKRAAGSAATLSTEKVTKA